MWLNHPNISCGSKKETLAIATEKSPKMDKEILNTCFFFFELRDSIFSGDYSFLKLSLNWEEHLTVTFFTMKV